MHDPPRFENEEKNVDISPISTAITACLSARPDHLGAACR
jgi:hypothetical protein